MNLANSAERDSIGAASRAPSVNAEPRGFSDVLQTRQHRQRLGVETSEKLD